MTVLAEGQFEFEGITFGGLTDGLVIEDADLDAPSMVTNDIQNPFGNNVFMGRDRLAPGVWSFNISTTAYTAAAGMDAARAFYKAWRSTLNQPNVLKPLYFCAGGDQRMVYGRPRRISGLKPDFMGQKGIQKIVAEFQLADSFVYEGGSINTARIDMIPQAGGGLTTPITTPIKTVWSTGYTEDTISVGGDANPPFTVLIHGPVTDPYVSGTGWKIALKGTLAYDRYITVNTRTLEAKWDNGTNASNMLATNSSLGTRLTVGDQRVAFGGSDDSYTSYAEVQWRNASYSL